MKLVNFLFGIVVSCLLLLIILSKKEIIFNISVKNNLTSFTFSPYPLAKEDLIPDFSQVSARSFIVIDYDSGQILATRNPKEQLPPASLTKMMTALVALEYFSFDEWLLIEDEYPVGKTMRLKKGRMMKVRDLLYGLLIHSANDAAWVLANNYNQKNSDDSISPETNLFIQRMNTKAREMGLNQTNFINFSGEEDDGHYSTVFDLAQLTRIFLKNEFLSSTAQIKSLIVYDHLGDPYFLETTNKLLEDGFEGVKTGWTDQAGECFAGFFSKDNRKLITVVLGSEDRFGDTRILVEQVMSNFSWVDYSERNSVDTASI